MSKSPSLRRIKADIRELSIDPSDQYHAAPLEHDMFEWHFTIRGAEDTDFAGGVYHGRILLPPEYPFKPPNIVFLTPSGRFECGVKVCLSFSAHHPELWQPAWGIRLILEALISFLPTPADGAIGAIDWTSEERKKLAKESVKFRCPVCCAADEMCVDLLPEIKAKGGNAEDKKKTKFQEEIEKLKMLQFQNHAVDEKESKKDGEEETSTKSKSAEGATEEKQSVQFNDEANVAPKPPPSSPQEPEQEGIMLPGCTATQTNMSHTEASQQRATGNTTTIAPINVPRPPPLPENGARPATGTPANTAPAGVGDAVPQNNNDDAPIVSDNLLHGMLGFFAAIVIVLLRQAQSLVDELHSLEDGN